MRSRRLLTATAIACAACGTPLVAEPVDGGADAARDAPGDAAAEPGDAGAPRDADADAGGASLLANGTFDQGCEPWFGYKATLAGAASGLHGAACSVCVDGAPTPPDGYSVAAFATRQPEIGGTYAAEIWVRATAAATTSEGNVVLRTLDDKGVEIEAAGSTYTKLGLSWQRFAIALSVTKPAAKLEMYAFARGQAGEECFLVDDAQLVRR